MDTFTLRMYDVPRTLAKLQLCHVIHTSTVDVFKLLLKTTRHFLHVILISAGKPATFITERHFTTCQVSTFASKELSITSSTVVSCCREGALCYSP